jgi:bacteriocin biosynthesis cyclodehydratase domain-containing protein
VLPGVIGVLQANEALKILVGYGEPLVGRLLMFDAQSTTFRELKLRRDPHCATCGDGARDAATRDGDTSQPALEVAGAGAACT